MLNTIEQDNSTDSIEKRGFAGDFTTVVLDSNPTPGAINIVLDEPAACKATLVF